MAGEGELRCSVNGSGVMSEPSPMPALTIPGSLEGADGLNRVSVIACDGLMLPRSRYGRVGQFLCRMGQTTARVESRT